MSNESLALLLHFVSHPMVLHLLVAVAVVAIFSAIVVVAERLGKAKPFGASGSKEGSQRPAAARRNHGAWPLVSD